MAQPTTKTHTVVSSPQAPKTLDKKYAEAQRRIKPMTDDQARKLLKDLETGKTQLQLEPSKPQPRPVGISEENVKRFILGEITLAQLEGMTMEQAYAAAQVGHTMFKSGKFEEARTIFEGLVVGNPYDAYFHASLGSIYLQETKHSMAAEEFELALRLDPRMIGARVNLGEIFLQMGRTDLAREMLEIAVKLDAGATDPAGGRGRALLTALGERKPSGAEKPAVPAPKAVKTPVQVAGKRV